MRLLPQDQMQVWVSPEGTVVVGAHEHNGAVWWTELPNPLENPVARGDDKRVVVDLVDRTAVG